MAKMSDPHHALVSFQECLSDGNFQPDRCSLHRELSYLVDFPTGSPRMTYALIDSDNVVKAMVLFSRVGNVKNTPCFAMGYAVAEQFRRQGLALEIVEKAIAEFSTYLKEKTSQLYINAVVGVENIASQKVAGRILSDTPTAITDEVSGLPALYYLRLFQC
jgi:hypothetical protein